MDNNKQKVIELLIEIDKAGENHCYWGDTQNEQLESICNYFALPDIRKLYDGIRTEAKEIPYYKNTAFFFQQNIVKYVNMAVPSGFEELSAPNKIYNFAAMYFQVLSLIAMPTEFNNFKFTDSNVQGYMDWYTNSMINVEPHVEHYYYFALMFVPLIMEQVDIMMTELVVEDEIEVYDPEA